MNIFLQWHFYTMIFLTTKNVLFYNIFLRMKFEIFYEVLSADFKFF